MKNLKHIKVFTFDHASYQIAGSEGETALLEINYKDNSFSIMNANNISVSMKAEAEEIAKDLLKRKHAVNFANK